MQVIWMTAVLDSGSRASPSIAPEVASPSTKQKGDQALEWQPVSQVKAPGGHSARELADCSALAERFALPAQAL